MLPLVALGSGEGPLLACEPEEVEPLPRPSRNTLRRLTSLVEPLVVLLMGGFVGFVVLSILLPIFQANTIVK